eukprot:Blabericola_migrator_1__9696@NODE_5303_length_814_cov_3_060241_g3398_i0_p1_GENE_NODE_5303_length_814_cov_3_060241_g3398_i0NODE_5303_length_814_cov_3_060241_g3398_i0_p1_ORF_typecomplete_len175_score23_02_NODE_5303_length_814_cov_3_060241_g3398_i0263787
MPSIKLAETLVNSHMALLLKVSTDRELLYTAYDSEPMLAWPALEHLLKHSNEVLRLTASAIHTGCLAAGVMGEIFVRLALLLKRCGPDFQTLRSWQEAIFGTADAPMEAFINFVQFTWAGGDLNESLLWESFKRKAALIPKSQDQCGFDLVILCGKEIQTRCSRWDKWGPSSFR